MTDIPRVGVPPPPLKDPFMASTVGADGAPELEFHVPIGGLRVNGEPAAWTHITFTADGVRHLIAAATSFLETEVAEYERRTDVGNNETPTPASETP